MKIIKHSSQTYPTIATGSLVGMDVNGTLEITNTFPFPTIDASTADAREDSIQNLAAAAPRSKANHAYQNEMIRLIRDVNIDANNVGWYTSTSMGNFINANMIENQFFYQKEPTERTVALVYDTSRSVQGTVSLRAFRLSSLFITAFKEGKFTTDRFVEVSQFVGTLLTHRLAFKRAVSDTKTSSRNCLSQSTTPTFSHPSFTAYPKHHQKPP